MYTSTKVCIVNVLLLLQLQNWLNTIGYTLAFGTILAKMFRVYYIFNNPSPSKKVNKHTYSDTY